MSAAKQIRVKLVRSAIGYDQRQRTALRGLGLRRLQHVVTLEDTPAVRGLIRQVIHLVAVEEG